MPTATMTAAPCAFRTMAVQVRAAGLLNRRLGYYSVKIGLTVAAFAATWAVFFVVGSSWWTVVIAASLGVISTQLGFIGHDAGHRQISDSPLPNRLIGLGVGNALIGLSFGWWVPKHSAHHAHPNEVDRDPDIGVGLVAPPADGAQAEGRRSFAAWMTRRQAELFFPLMLLRSTGLYVSGVQDLLRRRDRAALTEGLLLALHMALYLTAVFWVLSPLKAIAFICVHEAVFSMYLGCSFAPNHKGMPIIDAGSDMSFAQRQVISARNLTGGRWINFIFGGLNYQIEHHLFPAMPRPNLARAQHLVRKFCIDNGFGYRQESAINSYRVALRNLRMAAIA
ncbi:MAG: fatty acid desaturase family protein [Acidimicrobiales bacterium]